MAEKGNGGRRDKMRDECVRMHASLLEHREISLVDLAQEIGASVHTARRWVKSYGLIKPVEIRRGIVIVEEVL
jgi:transposase-like protein